MGGRQLIDKDVEGDGAGPLAHRPNLPSRLSTRILWFTMLSIMLAEIAIFVPSVSNFRRDWLHGKIDIVAAASLVTGGGPAGHGGFISPEDEAELLQALNAQLIAVEADGVSRLLARTSEVAPVDMEVNLATESIFGSIGAAFGTLVFGGDRFIRVLGPAGSGGNGLTAEIVLIEQPLRRAMLVYSRNIFTVSLLLASFAGLLVYVAISRYLLRPMRAMTESMVAFSENPQNPYRIIKASNRDDEIGIAERHLADMQKGLARMLREQQHLADLGLAVSKINHDLRNTLASAQLVSDRLSDIPDPQVQRFAPTLIRSLDRALHYTQSVLTYGRAVESNPQKRVIRLRLLVDDIFETVGGMDSRVTCSNDVSADVEMKVDPDHFHRALSNLVRNAIQSFESEVDEALVRRVQVDARVGEDSTVTIGVEDTGPGVSPRARENLFKAFRGSTRAGGTGLGLAIAAEIVQAHGGSIRHVEDHMPGTRFEIVLPGDEMHNEFKSE
ncbi:HAMP domain-containing histidine kinase [Aureimonas fodinaquatilis]|uniref:histidine kinase n=1 Tax=Aureimonas fodinaquatilis TaxID=2565783 RepID=A0A5B0DUU1_9HYPH|nr:HAMP domain-containing sensor histidine kinase [Aureimonas fodinaquatilis]KAA0968969.1 HAMP domain-containing histidine kinase [Aureimonas fodinaquatilis]